MTTTDERVLREALGRRYVTPRTQRPIERLRALIELESAGDGVSRGFDAISGVIEAEASEADPWRRPDADLEVILITRSDDRSDVEANEFADWFDGLAGRGVRARVSGAVPGVAISYRRVIDGTGGVAAGPGPVLGGFFQEVTEDLEAVGLRTAFFLSRVPVLETLRVEVAEPAPRGETVTIVFGTGGPPERRYAYDVVRNAVIFPDYVPPAGAGISFRYVPD